jgi:Flp pilus assembly CpaF family ATPase
LSEWRSSFEKLIHAIGDIYKNTDKYMSIYSIDRHKAESEIRQFQSIIKRAALGEKSAVTYIINQYSKILLSKAIKITKKEIKDLINFDDIFDNDIRILFEIVLSITDISYIIDNYMEYAVNSYRISENIIKKYASDNTQKIKSHYKSNASRIRLISYIAYSMEYGQDAVDSLQYHDINEIGIISYDYIYIGYKGNKYYIEFLKLSGINELENIQKKTTRNAVMPYDRQTPAVTGAKNNSNRITVAGYDAAPSNDVFYYNERIFNLKNISLEEMRDTYNTIDESLYKFLMLNQKGKGSFFVTGSDMGVGKSTFLLSLIEKVPDNWGIGIIDTQNELQAFKKFKKNIITIIENPKTTVARSFELMLKMARDVLGVGEITKPDEVAELINAVLRLNAGAFATMHSFSAFETVTNLRNLMLRTSMYKSADVAEADISRGLDLVIHMERHPKNRKRIIVQNIVEIVYKDYADEMHTENAGKYSDIIKLVKTALDKYISGKCYKYNELFRFNAETDSWDIINAPSENYIEKTGRFFSGEEKSALKDIFMGCTKRVGVNNI